MDTNELEVQEVDKMFLEKSRENYALERDEHFHSVWGREDGLHGVRNPAIGATWRNVTAYVNAYIDGMLRRSRMYPPTEF